MLNGLGEVAFYATIQDGMVSEGIFLVVPVPEPGVTAQLLAGLGLLAALGRLRSRQPA